MLFKRLFPSKDSSSAKSMKTDPVKISTFFRKNKWLILISVLSLILLLFFFEKNENTKSESQNSTNLYSYSELLHRDLEEILSNMSGVGKCEVVITFFDGGETVYACDESVSTTPDKTDSEKKYVLVSSRSEGLVLKVHSPSVLGVAVICQGGESTRVKNDITEVLSRTLGISADRISVKKMKP